MKFLIVGRSGTGKDALARGMEVFCGLKQLKSYTTRPKRTPKEDTHIFVTPEQANAYMDRAAETVVNGYEYFATKQQVENGDVYIIDPNGLYQLVANMPHLEFMVVYLFADKELSKKRAVTRAEDEETERAVVEKRMKDEDEQFTDFENRFVDGDESIAENVTGIITFYNNDGLEAVERFAKELFNLHRQTVNLTKVVEALKKDGVLTVRPADAIKVWHGDEEVPRVYSTARFVTLLQHDNEGLAMCMKQYLALHYI